jgi:hypothetical protein
MMTIRSEVSTSQLVQSHSQYVTNVVDIAIFDWCVLEEVYGYEDCTALLYHVGKLLRPELN